MRTISQGEHKSGIKDALGQNMDRTAIAKFCTRHRVYRLSVIHADPLKARTPAGSYDVLVEFESGESPSTFAVIGMEIELSELAGRRVDLRTYDQLKHTTARRLLDGARTVVIA